MLRVGVDVGGTFTDLFAYDETSGRTYSAKVPTTVANQADGVLRSLVTSGIMLRDISFLAHGTTTGVNALLERRGARTALLTTSGFRDVLEIMRTDRETGYDLLWQKPEPFVPRQFRREVNERVLVDGTVQIPLDEGTSRGVIAELRDAAVESIAVCLLHSYANGEHERQLRELIAGVASDLAVSLSSEINAEMREFERTNTTVIDAYVKPVMVRYIQSLLDGLEEGGFAGRLFLMQGSGGMFTAQRACEKPIGTLSSGPAAGAIAAAQIAATADVGDVVTFDVGGTSTDVSLVHDGTPYLETQKPIEWGLPARVPMIDVASVGAGGGSIGWIDKGGALKMGPQSAGSQPGPVCYGQGGTDPTLSDALLLKGILGGHLARGAVELDAEAARQEITRRLADPLGLSLERVVNGMVEIAQANMANAVRSVSVWKGVDPRDLALVAFGGAGGMVAGHVARLLQIPKVVIPPVPGNASAMGTLMTNFQEDTELAYLVSARDGDVDEINEYLTRLRKQTTDVLLGQGVPESNIRFTCLAEMRYEGQVHQLRIPLDYPIKGHDIEHIVQRFEDAYERIYTIRLRVGRPEIVNLRVTAIGTLPQYSPPQFGADQPDFAPIGQREVLEEKWRKADVYNRYTIPAGTRIEGPTILEEDGSTIWIASDMMCDVDSYGNLIVHTHVTS